MRLARIQLPDNSPKGPLSISFPATILTCFDLFGLILTSFEKNSGAARPKKQLATDDGPLTNPKIKLNQTKTRYFHTPRGRGRPGKDMQLGTRNMNHPSTLHPFYRMC